MTFSLLQVQWAKLGIVLGVFAALAVVLALCILLVNKLCRTDENETVEDILSHLAGANCGGCGCSGCRGFAEKLVRGEAELSDCHVTAAGEKERIAATLGVHLSPSAPTVSVCRCSGGENAADAFEYVGAQDCTERSRMAGGGKACPYGCMGTGSCEKKCPEGAIHVECALARVDTALCVGCGICLHGCPKGLFARIPADAKVYVACSSHEKGKAVMEVCKKGCIGCGKCAKVCPAGAIKMERNLPVIDYSLCQKCGKCAASCPRGTIVVR